MAELIQAIDLGQPPAVLAEQARILQDERAALIADITVTDDGLSQWPVEMRDGLLRLNDARRRQLAEVEKTLAAAGFPLEREEDPS